MRKILPTLIFGIGLQLGLLVSLSGCLGDGNCVSFIGCGDNIANGSGNGNASNIEDNRPEPRHPIFADQFLNKDNLPIGNFIYDSDILFNGKSSDFTLRANFELGRIDFIEDVFLTDISGNTYYTIRDNQAFELIRGTGGITGKINMEGYDGNIVIDGAFKTKGTGFEANLNTTEGRIWGTITDN